MSSSSASAYMSQEIVVSKNVLKHRRRGGAMFYNLISNLACLLTLLQSIKICESYSHNSISSSCNFTPKLCVKSIRISRSRSKHSNMVMYLPPNGPVSQTQQMVAERLLSGQHRTHPRKVPVLASSDTLPTFEAAHGLLHPHTVSLLEEATSAVRSPAVSFFLDTYREQGPMACLPLLSDSSVLPELTKVLRSID